MGFFLPQSVFDQHIILLGKTRSGKSSAMRVLVEHLLDCEKPVCIVDPKGDWYGLKASSDGKKAGYPVVIFGGEHGDVPLNARSGAAVAELLATGNRSAIIDLGGWMVADRTRFWIDFSSTYFRTHRGRHWLVVDEVHNFCPKGASLKGDTPMMLHWANRLASEGLGKGISMIAASQRPQKVHNDFLTSCETLVAMRVIHAADRKALKDWIDGCGDEEQGKELINTIAQMNRGEGWVWSPEAEFGPKRLQFPMFKTFDSFRPRGASEAKLKGWAEVDLAEVTKKLEAAVKEAEANDPAKLKARIRQLEAELKSGPLLKADTTPIHVMELKKAIAHVNERDVMIRALTKYVGQMEDFISEQAQRFVQVEKSAHAASQMNPPEFKAPPKVNLDKHIPPGKTFANPANPVVYQQTGKMVSFESANGLTGPETRILVALAELSAIGKHSAPRPMVAGWAAYSPRGSAFTNPLGALNSKGLISYPGQGMVCLTDEGRRIIGARPSPSHRELIERVRSICSGPEVKLLNALLDHGPELTRTELAEHSGYSMHGSAFTNPLGALRSKGLVEYPKQGHVRLAEWLCES